MVRVVSHIIIRVLNESMDEFWKHEIGTSHTLFITVITFALVLDVRAAISTDSQAHGIAGWTVQRG